MPRPGLPLVHFHDTCCGSVAELRSIILKARRLAADHAEQERAAAAVKTSGEPNAMSPDLSESKPFCSPQDQIQWSILFLGRHLRRSSPWEREECLAGRMGVGAPARRPTVPPDYPRLPGVLQTERANLSTSPKVVFE
jgi:hypothetical protein